MKKLLFLAFFSLCFVSLSMAQDFSLDELMRSRTENYPTFESLVHGKGYTLNHLESTERSSVFKNGTNVITYNTYYDDKSIRYKRYVAIKFETQNLETYERLKRQVEAGAKYSKTKLRRTSTKEYLEHLYRNEQVSIHLFDISYKDDSKPYYMIEIYSLYSDN